ncbi:ArsR/SmtB family transcription factor [Sulfoacidibacillus thermotolerans]|uniref:HTH arsR-type domain-containing protein n=1 Tax=Sulfoacidibacillus thermotolerans TaxID=1765684 RepID=A0A2U3D822_SULT2|nr:metalloregulator ArsR/SmtB family transcription factor [Sulfoacidibacillus thermotolerans]PWI57423.1 hypothetical protein BM613_08860 [Sulfoacidibacillus thermotolerans]
MNDSDYVAYAALFRLLSDVNRLRILYTVKEDAQSVSRIMELTNLPQTLVSYHLRVLRENGIVQAERDGPFILYRIAAATLWPWITQTSAFTSEIQQGECRHPQKRRRGNRGYVWDELSRGE